MGSFISAAPPPHLHGRQCSCWIWWQTWSSRSCPQEYWLFSGQTGLITASSALEKKDPPTHTQTTFLPPLLNHRFTFSHMYEVTAGSFQANLLTRGVFIDSVLLHWSFGLNWMDSQTLTCIFGGEFFFFFTLATETDRMGRLAGTCAPLLPPALLIH